MRIDCGRWLSGSRTARWISGSSSMGDGLQGGSLSSQGAATGAPGSSQYTAKAVACRFRAELQQQMQRDWRRVGADVRLGSGVPLAWLRGPTPVLSLERFWQRWGPIFTVTTDGEVAIAVSTAGL